MRLEDGHYPFLREDFPNGLYQVLYLLRGVRVIVQDEYPPLLVRERDGEPPVNLPETPERFHDIARWITETTEERYRCEGVQAVVKPGNPKLHSPKLSLGILELEELNPSLHFPR